MQLKKQNQIFPFLNLMNENATKNVYSNFSQNKACMTFCFNQVTDKYTGKLTLFDVRCVG